jgi:formylglycine-generating enzyme required for sulfatase activity
VGEKKPNAWGLHDMVGNVWEWCLDSWVCNYQDKSDFKKAIPLGMGRRVIRGGAWDMDVFRCRSAYRSSEGEFIATKKTGFRVLIEV